jgi:hypothetical protein
MKALKQKAIQWKRRLLVSSLGFHNGEIASRPACRAGRLAMTAKAPKHQNEIFELLKYVKIRKHAFDHELIKRTMEVATALKTLDINLKAMRFTVPLARARTIVLHQDNLIAIAPSQYGGQKEIFNRIKLIIDAATKVVHNAGE